MKGGQMATNSSSRERKKEIFRFLGITALRVLIAILLKKPLRGGYR